MLNEHVRMSMSNEYVRMNMLNEYVAAHNMHTRNAIANEYLLRLFFKQLQTSSCNKRYFRTKSKWL